MLKHLSIAAALLMMPLTVCAQDTVETKTITTTLEVVEVFVDGQLVSKTEPPVVVGTPSVVVEETPVIVVGQDALVAYTLGTDLALSQVKAVSPGKFAIKQPGDYLVFLTEPPPSTRVTVAAPVPDFDVSTLAPLAAQLADALDDDPTRQALATAYHGELYTLSSPAFADFPAAAAQIKRAAIGVFAKRQGASTFKNWVDGFQRPMQAEINRLGVDDTETYRLAMGEVVAGLRVGLAKRQATTRCADGRCTTTGHCVRGE